MTTALAVITVVLALVLSRSLWRHRLNPITVGVFVWAPALVLATVPREFLSPVYAHLNQDLGLRTALSMAVAYGFFAAGVVCMLALVGARHWDRQLGQGRVQVHDGRMLLLYLLGLAVFVFSFAQSGLGNLANLEADEVQESQLKLHLGLLSFVVLLLDIGSVVFLAKMLETRRYIYGLPALITVLCQMGTLQKSRTLFVVVAALLLFLQYPVAAREMILGNRRRKLAAGLMVVLLLAALFVMNALRGIGVVQLTAFESPLAEQAYIYSGATAVLNVSAAMEGHVPSAPPTDGLVLARPITWHLVNRNLLNPTKYFEGINTGTYLIYGWSDFRWFGMVITPFLTGLLVALYLWMSVRKTIIGLVFGAIGFQAVVLSVNTDVVFDPTTLILMTITVMAQLIAGPLRTRRGAADAGTGGPAMTRTG